ncbi:MAG: DUF2189 domain-containing protein [Rhodobacteraceae bacterium]|nr:DUF2189 domain-containing protein [Paracoccaceae bacterium]
MPAEPVPDFRTTDAPPSPPAVLRPVTYDTLRSALQKGFEDFRAEPGWGLFFGGAYVIGGFILWAIALWIGNVGLMVPLAFAFPLIGPFAAIGLYEVSRRRESGEPLGRAEVLGAVFRQRNGQIPFLGVVMLFMALVWIVLSRLTFAIFMGNHTMTNVFTSTGILFSFDGFFMVLVELAVGFSVAFLVYAITVIGMPMLLDREVDFVTAMITSFEVVTSNLRPMLAWAVLLAALLLVGLLPAFLGLFIVLPVLGHGTWHLYRSAVAAA